MSVATRSLGVDVWYVRTEDVRDEATVQACVALLTPDERAKQAAFVFEESRHEYLVTRALSRAVLASCVGVGPAELQFVRTAHGRPELEPASRYRFNLTNTIRLVACATAEGREIGVDAEPLTRGADVLEVAETVFTSGEREMLASIPLGARPRRALELWTLKEAYIKARGLGMSLPVERVEMRFEGGPRVRFLPPVSDEPSRWRFATYELEGHLVSLCVEARGPVPPEVSLRRADLHAMLRVPPES